MSPVVSAERSLFWAGIALMVAIALVESSRRDLRRAKGELRSERDRRAGLEDDVEKLRQEQDAMLDHISELRRERADPA